jgi:endonuclease/exonuclease/phosphatase family metal-dependent hydrolase
MKKMLLNLLMLSIAAAGFGCSTIAPSKPATLTVLTYNIHHGEGTDGKLDLERIARIIRSENPDLVALQEVDEKTERTGNISQAEELALLSGIRHALGKAMDYRGGAYGLVILSRWPIKDPQVHQLPQRAGREPRILFVAQIESPHGKLTFANTHLDHQLEEVRLEQARALNKILAETKSPALLCGDFNAGPESTTMKFLSEHWLDTAGDHAANTIPAANPRKRIDYILAAPKNRWTTETSRVLEEPIASDHRPVLTRVTLKD